jgi:ribosomal protein S18 acetylase RimI-like enzyme
LDSSLPVLEEALGRAAERLSEKLGEKATVNFRTYIDETLIKKLTEIDHEKFRSELWYSNEELLEKSLKKDFICLVADINDEPTAFLYGYDDEFDPHWFFLDEIATRTEGRGIGKVLIVLLLVYCFELNYTFVTLYTEDHDEKGRKLREFYEHLGFTYMTTDPELGVIMKYQINEQELVKLYNRVMYSEGGPHPPYLST